MANFKFRTVKAPSSTATSIKYIGLPQHERIYSKKEAYDYAAEKTGYKATVIQAAFLAFLKVLQQNAERAVLTHIDKVATFATKCTGGFATITGPWVAGKNLLIVRGTTYDDFRKSLAAFIPTNDTEGASPAVNTVFDATTQLYDVITGTNSFSVAGSNLAPDTTATDEGVWLRNDATGVETKASVSHSDIMVVTANFTTALAAGDYTLIVRTRSGMGEGYGVAEAARKIVVV